MPVESSENHLTKQRIDYFTRQLRKMTMKRYLFVLCLFMASSSFGQRHSISINYKPSLTYFGKQSQSFHDDYFVSRKGDQTFNSSVNILYTYRPFSKVSISTGIEYSQQGQNINFNADSVYPSNSRKILKIKLNYLRIPLTINYSIFKIKNSELNIYSGISMGLATSRKDNYENVVVLREYFGYPSNIDRYKKVDWAIPFGAAYKTELTKNVFANFGIEYLIGLTESFTENRLAKFGVLSQFDNSKQSRLSLNIGIGFSLK